MKKKIKTNSGIIGILSIVKFNNKAKKFKYQILINIRLMQNIFIICISLIILWPKCMRGNVHLCKDLNKFFSNKHNAILHKICCSWKQIQIIINSRSFVLQKFLCGILYIDLVNKCSVFRNIVKTQNISAIYDGTIIKKTSN